MDPEGRTKCGGDGCDGVVATASGAWRKARDSEQEIISAMEEVEKLSKMVSPTGPGLFRFRLTVVDVLTYVFSAGVGGQAASRRGEA